MALRRIFRSGLFRPDRVFSQLPALPAVRFKVKGEDAYILAWTTTPWTLPSNVALCVNPDEDYVKVTSKGYKRPRLLL